MVSKNHNNNNTGCPDAAALFDETRKLIEKSHLATADVFSNNLHEIKNKIKDLNDMVETLANSLATHAVNEAELHQRIETFISKIDLDDLEGAATIYRDAVGIKRMALGAVVFVSVVGSLGGAFIWMIKKFTL